MKFDSTLLCSRKKSAARSSACPPISPIKMIPEKCDGSQKKKLKRHSVKNNQRRGKSVPFV